MALELVIAGRHPLPPGDRPWIFELEHRYPEDASAEDVADEDDPGDLLDEGDLVLYEPEPDDAEFLAGVARIVGFQPAAVVVIRPAGWDMSVIAAEVVAHALEATVYFVGYDSPEPHVVLDAIGKRRAAGSLQEIEQAIVAARNDPRPYFDRWQQAEQDRYEAEALVDPNLEKENDWSDL